MAREGSYFCGVAIFENAVLHVSLSIRAGGPGLIYPLAAGNCVVLKMHHFNSHVGRLLLDKLVNQPYRGGSLEQPSDRAGPPRAPNPQPGHGGAAVKEAAAAGNVAGNVAGAEFPQEEVPHPTAFGMATDIARSVAAAAVGDLLKPEEAKFYIDSDAVAVILGGTDVTEYMLTTKAFAFDHIIFLGLDREKDRMDGNVTDRGSGSNSSNNSNIVSAVAAGTRKEGIPAQGSEAQEAVSAKRSMNASMRMVAKVARLVHNPGAFSTLDSPTSSTKNPGVLLFPGLESGVPSSSSPGASGSSPGSADWLSDPALLKRQLAKALYSKVACCGRLPNALDYLLVPSHALPDVVRTLREIVCDWYGETGDVQGSASYGRIVSEDHYWNLLRLRSGSDERKLVYLLGDTDVSPETWTPGPNPKTGRARKTEDADDFFYFAPVLIVQPSLTDAVMREQIRGPILPILTYARLEEVPEIVKRVNRPTGKTAPGVNSSAAGRDGGPLGPPARNPLVAEPIAGREAGGDSVSIEELAAVSSGSSDDPSGGRRAGQDSRASFEESHPSLLAQVAYSNQQPLGVRNPKDSEVGYLQHSRFANTLYIYPAAWSRRHGAHFSKGHPEVTYLVENVGSAAVCVNELLCQNPNLPHGGVGSGTVLLGFFSWIHITVSDWTR